MYMEETFFYFTSCRMNSIHLLLDKKWHFPVDPHCCELVPWIKHTQLLMILTCLKVKIQWNPTKKRRKPYLNLVNISFDRQLLKLFSPVATSEPDILYYRAMIDILRQFS